VLQNYYNTMADESGFVLSAKDICRHQVDVINKAQWSSICNKLEINWIGLLRATVQRKVTHQGSY